MAKVYSDFKMDPVVADKFRRIKSLYQFQTGREYTVSGFIDILLEKFSEKAIRELKKRKAIIQSRASEAPGR